MWNNYLQQVVSSRAVAACSPSQAPINDTRALNLSDNQICTIRRTETARSKQNNFYAWSSTWIQPNRLEKQNLKLGLSSWTKTVSEEALIMPMHEFATDLRVQRQTDASTRRCNKPEPPLDDCEAQSLTHLLSSASSWKGGGAFRRRGLPPPQGLGFRASSI